jgi:hypothetical protein
VEVQLALGNAGDFWVIGTTLEVPDLEKRRMGRRHLNLTDNFEKPVGQWNKMEIEARGDESQGLGQWRSGQPRHQAERSEGGDLAPVGRNARPLSQYQSDAARLSPAARLSQLFGLGPMMLALELSSRWKTPPPRPQSPAELRAFGNQPAFAVARPWRPARTPRHLAIGCAT